MPALCALVNAGGTQEARSRSPVQECGGREEGQRIDGRQWIQQGKNWLSKGHRRVMEKRTEKQRIRRRLVVGC
jgi:hypothetical protein